MGWKKWMAGLLGLGNHETNHSDNHNNRNDQNNYSDNDNHQQQQQQEDEEEEEEEMNHNNNYIKSNRKGFSVPVQQIGPVFIPCRPGDGGLQGLGWYTKRLKVDEDGDVADEFFDEVLLETSNTEAHHKHFPKFEVKVNTKSAKARNPVLSREGAIQQVVEYRGRSLLV